MPATFVYPFTKIYKDKEIIRPLVPVIFENPLTKKMIRVYALLDTGADACLLPAYIPNNTDHDLKHPTVQTSINAGINGNTIPTWKHTFKIHLFEHQKPNVVWKSKETLIDCVDHDNVPPLLGCKGFLEFMNIRFNYKTSRIIIELP